MIEPFRARYISKAMYIPDVAWPVEEIEGDVHGQGEETSHAMTG
jgi:hypothetical protein